MRGHIVVRQQPATAVYLNSHDEVVILQQADRDEDRWVYVSKSNAVRVAYAILRAAGAVEAHEANLIAPRSEAEPERAPSDTQVLSGEYSEPQE